MYLHTLFHPEIPFKIKGRSWGENSNRGEKKTRPGFQPGTLTVHSNVLPLNFVQQSFILTSTYNNDDIWAEIICIQFYALFSYIQLYLLYFFTSWVSNNYKNTLLTVLNSSEDSFQTRKKSQSRSEILRIHRNI